MVSAVVFGCAGTTLSEDERAFFSRVRPWGFILFRRNVDDPDQVRALIDDLRTCVRDPQAPILVDQEGGRVQRLGPPHWRKYPPARVYREATNTLDEACHLARLGARLMAHDLSAVGITVDCAPVLDIPVPDAHDIIGDRAYSDDPDAIAALGRAVAEGLLAGGVLPVMKHLPGHGRARSDSHMTLPTVPADLAELEQRDFRPFRSLADLPIAMTAHIVFDAIDPDRPVTVSKRGVAVIRERLGFDGLLLTDDLSMRALSGGFRERAADALAAGCDIVLHCNGDMVEMAAVADGAGELRGPSRRRADDALRRLQGPRAFFDVEAGRARFDRMMTGRLDVARGPDVGEAQAAS